MRVWLPLSLLALVALAALVQFFRQGAAPAPAPSAPPLSRNSDGSAGKVITPEQHVLPPIPPGETLAPLEQLAVRGKEKSLPLPPSVENATDKDVKDFEHRLADFFRSASEEDGLLARQLWTRFNKDYRDLQTKKHRQESEQRRSVKHAEATERSRLRREANPLPPPDPNRRPSAPLIPPPKLDKPVNEEQE